jgi:hypothetical protein
MTGFVSDNANFAIMETAVEADTIINYKLLYGDSKTITQIFKFHLWNTLANRNAGQGFSCTLTSSGTPTFA